MRTDSRVGLLASGDDVDGGLDSGAADAEYYGVQSMELAEAKVSPTSPVAQLIRRQISESELQRLQFRIVRGILSVLIYGYEVMAMYAFRTIHCEYNQGQLVMSSVGSQVR